MCVCVCVSVYLYVSLSVYLCVCQCDCPLCFRCPLCPCGTIATTMAQTAMTYISLYICMYVYIYIYIYIFIKWASGVLASNSKWVGSSMLKHETTATACQAHERPPWFIGQIRGAEATLKHVKRKAICPLGT